MKKFSYLLSLLLIGGLFFNSCTPDDDDPIQNIKPLISFITLDTYTYSDVTVELGGSILVGVTATSNNNSGKKLEKFKMYWIVDNQPQEPFIIDSIFSESAFTYSQELFPTESGRLFVMIEDKDEQTSSTSFEVIVNNETPLAEDTFVWERIANLDGTGLSDFGLQWIENEKKSFYAVISKDGAEKLVELTPDKWTSITSKEELAVAVEEGTDLEEYKKLEILTASHDKVIATKYDDEYYMIHITYFSDGGMPDNIRTITGAFKY